MISLSKYAKFLIEAKMTLSIANNIFAKHGYPNASQMNSDELKKAWKDLVVKLHPDKGGNLEQAQDINAAYDFLKTHKPSSTTYTYKKQPTPKKHQTSKNDDDDDGIFSYFKKRFNDKKNYDNYKYYDKKYDNYKYKDPYDENFLSKYANILNEQKLNKDEYNRRYEFVTDYLSQLIHNAPGNTREEKLTYVWKHHKQTMEKLTKGLKALSFASIWGRSEHEPEESYKSKFQADKYYIRFGDIPIGGKSKNWALGTNEIGISAYEAKWNTQINKWEIIENQLSALDALYSFTYDITMGKGRPVYLIQGQELDDIGSDGEAMLDKNKIKIIKKLEPDEFFSKEIGEDWYSNI